VASIISPSPKKTFAIAKAIGSSLQCRSVVALVGDLGAGKTHFVKGLAAGLDFVSEATSPTFTLIHEYVGGRLPLYHFDFYRLDRAEEALRLGLEDYLDGDGVCVIEWADKFASLLPPHARWFELRILADTQREIIERG
jgi:tRNA threonylcarbamoyladenosine biosynthesis protein TsaE